MQPVPVFPTMFYETKINIDLAYDIIKEIKELEPTIRNISEATQPHPVSQYSTDFSKPLHINLFHDHVVPFLESEVEKIGYKFKLTSSWVSCYTGPHGSHPMHHHSGGWDGKTRYSGILYLSNIGYTDFFTSNMSAENYMHVVSSEVGKVVFFPSIVPHQYRTEQYDGNNRYTLPFNCDFERV